MMDHTTPSPSTEFAAFIAIDWADSQHTVCMQAAGSTVVDRFTVAQSPEALSDWCQRLLSRFPDQKLAFIIEGNHAGLIYHLLSYPLFVIYPINPKAAAKYREAIHPNGSKTDPIDADLLLDFLLHHRERLRPWLPDTVETRTLGRMAEDRRALVDTRTAICNLLTSRLKLVFPQVLEMFEEITSPLVADFLVKWPSLEKLQKAQTAEIRKFFYAHHSRSRKLIDERLEIVAKAKPLTQDAAILTTGTRFIQAVARQLQTLHQSIRDYDEQLEALTRAHSLAPIFQGLPGAGKVLVPRLISAFGTRPDYWPKAYDLLCFSGVAPIEIGSGKQYTVTWRWNCPRFLRQTFVEFAGCSIKTCGWARQFYENQRAKGHTHHQAIRALAFKWIRILWKCWKTKTPYNELVYLQSIQSKKSPQPKA